mmetsp:Transcript_4140/g.16692  ORF Transcript_4140/g.16692 Transcript_4140/m.16692 type:complete len:318 (-) Transcript_4140:595-1548(-)
MFDPGAAKARQAAPSASRNIVSWVREEMPAAIKASLARDPSAVMVNVREVACGDPSCSPIDTVLAFVFANGRRAMTGIPAEMAQVMREDVARAIGDLEPELTAAHEDRDYVPPGAMPPLSVEADAALDRLRAALRRELVGLSAGDVVGICASLIDTLEQIEEDQLRQAEALPPGGGLPLPGGAGLQPPPLETVLPGGGVAGLVAGLPGAGGGQSSTGAPTSSAASLPGIATAAGSSSSSSSSSSGCRRLASRRRQPSRSSERLLVLEKKQGRQAACSTRAPRRRGRPRRRRRGTSCRGCARRCRRRSRRRWRATRRR